ncbi:MAG TPA: recombinase family protein, partial [Lachnospiraceae bacterium]|nr:recombinase family protein [Lachnospiraceae bacterium]
INAHTDIEYVDTYSDDGFTGTNFNRPDFQRMWSDLQSQRINCVIVKDLSRFGRDYIDVGNYLERVFPMMNIRFIAISDNIDSLTQAYDMGFLFKNIFNTQYAKDIQTKVNSSLSAKRQSGAFIGSFASYGYKKDSVDKHKLVIDEYPAEIVRRIFHEFCNGTGQITIAKLLNKENVLCPTAYKRSKGLKYHNCNRLRDTSYWTYSTVHRILQSEIYTGTMVQGKSYRKIMKGKATMKPKEEWIRVENTHPAIIDRGTWDKAQMLLSLDTRQNIDVVSGLQQNNHLFAGLIICGDCERAMCKNVSTGIFYYVCGSNKHYGTCSRHTIKYDTVYQIILSDLNACIKSVHDLQQIIEKHKPIKKTESLDGSKLAIQKAEKELSKCQEIKQNLYEDYCNNLLTKQELLSYKENYSKKEEALKLEIQTLTEKIQKTPEILFEESAWIKELLKYKEIKELDRDIVLKMVHNIAVYENKKIVITYNFTDELDTILNSEFLI